MAIALLAVAVNSSMMAETLPRLRKNPPGGDYKSVSAADANAEGNEDDQGSEYDEEAQNLLAAPILPRQRTSSASQQSESKP